MKTAKKSRITHVFFHRKTIEIHRQNVRHLLPTPQGLNVAYADYCAFVDEERRLYAGASQSNRRPVPYTVPAGRRDTVIRTYPSSARRIAHLISVLDLDDDQQALLPHPDNKHAQFQVYWGIKPALLHGSLRQPTTLHPAQRYNRYDNNLQLVPALLHTGHIVYVDGQEVLDTQSAVIESSNQKKAIISRHVHQKHFLRTYTPEGNVIRTLEQNGIVHMPIYTTVEYQDILLFGSAGLALQQEWRAHWGTNAEEMTEQVNTYRQRLAAQSQAAAQAEANQQAAKQAVKQGGKKRGKKETPEPVTSTPATALAAVQKAEEMKKKDPLPPASRPMPTVRLTVDQSTLGKKAQNRYTEANLPKDDAKEVIGFF